MVYRHRHRTPTWEQQNQINAALDRLIAQLKNDEDWHLVINSYIDDLDAPGEEETELDIYRRTFGRDSIRSLYDLLSVERED